MIGVNRGVGEEVIELKKEVDEVIEKGEGKICGMMEVVGKWMKEWKRMGLEGKG